MASTAWEAGTAYVQVVPSLDQFQNLIAKELRKIDPEVNLDPKVDSAKAKAEVAKAAKAASGATATIKAKVDSDQAEKALGAFARRAQARLAQTLASLPPVGLDANTADVDKKVEKLGKRIQKLAGKRIGFDVSAEDFEREADRIDRRLAALGKDAHLQLTFDSDAARRALSSTGQQIEAEDAKRTHRAVAEQARQWDAIATEDRRRTAQAIAEARRRAELLAEEERRGRERLGEIQQQAWLEDRRRTSQAADQAERDARRARQAAYDELFKELDDRDKVQQQAWLEDRRRAKQAADQAAKEGAARAQAEMGGYAREASKRVEGGLTALPSRELSIGSTEAESRLQVLRNELEHLGRAKIGVDIDDAAFEAELARIRAELAEVSKHYTASIQVKADVAGALAAIETVDAAAERVGKRKETPSFDVTGMARALSMVGLLTAALAAASTAVAPAAAALVGLGVAGGVAAQGLGGLLLGLQGVGAAVKAMQAYDAQVASDTEASASARTNSAQRIISAQHAVQAAQIQADRAAITSGQQAADARRALADAYESGARRVTEAQRALGDAQVHAAEQATSAERTLRGAQVASLDAQKALNLAREDAVRTLRDLQFELRGTALDEREQVLQLAAAQDALQRGQAAGVSGVGLEQLQIGAQRAQLALDQTRARMGDLTTEGKRWAQTGIEGSDGVVAAQRRAADSAQAVTDAQSALTRSQVDGARSVAGAQADLLRAQQESARGITDAQEQLTRSQQQSAWSQADSARQVADAQRALADTMADSGNIGSTAMNQLKRSMAQISPAAQQFAKYVNYELLPGIFGIRDAIAASLLPRLETSFRTLMTLSPELSAGLAETGSVIGDLAIAGSEMMTSGPWRADFRTIMSGNNQLMRTFGEAGLGLADAFRSLYVAALPLVQRFADWFRNSALLFDQFIQGRRVTGELNQWFLNMGDSLAKLWDVVTRVAIGLYDLSQALAPMGGQILEIVAEFADFIGQLSQSAPWLVQTIGLLALATSGFVSLFRTLGGGGAAIKSAYAVMTSLTGKVSDAVAAAGLQAGVLTEKFTGSAAAGQRVASAGEKVAGMAGKVAGALPIAGAAVAGVAIAMDALTVSGNEAADALLQGGAAAAQVTESMKGQDKVVHAAESGWLNFVPLIGPVVVALSSFVSSSDDAKKSMEEQLAAMNPLQRAHALAAQAQNNYLYALQSGQPTSLAAINAARDYALQTHELKLQEDALKKGLEGATEALKAQQEGMLSSVNADLAAQASRLGVQRAQQSLAEAIDRSGRGSLDAQEAEIQYQQALTASVAAAGDAARAANQHQGATEADAAAVRAQNDEIFRLIQQAGANAPPALLAMATGMSDADLRARGATISVGDLGTRMVTLPGAPGQPPFTIKLGADTTPAQTELDRFIATNEGRELILKIQAADVNASIRAPGRATGGVDLVAPMAAGGVRGMPAGIARVVPPNQPTLVGDRKRDNESYIPWNHSPRSLAILQVTAAALGQLLVPMAAGGALAGAQAPAVSVPLDPKATADGMTQLTGAVSDLTTKALLPLDDELTKVTVPALADTALQAGTLTAIAFATLQAALPPLTDQANTSSAQMQAAWVADTAAVVAMQVGHDAAWSRMVATSGASVNQITGPQFGALHAGLAGVQGGFDIATQGIGAIWDRLRGYVAEPIRWTLLFPINTGLRNAWGEIDRFFDLRKPWGGVPVAGFAAGSEDHRAQIAQGGTWRVWAEDETGGEAYIPLAPGKRRRSTDILSTVADRFGLQLMPRDSRLFADGGLWRQMWGIVNKQFPGATLNSAYRPGDPGYHGSGRATDLGGPMSAINLWLANTFANSTELIHTPGINLWHGAPHTYNAATQAEHRDHVHWAMANAAMLGGAPGAYGPAPGAPDIVATLNEKLAPARAMIADIQRLFGAGNIAAAVTGMANQAVQGAADWATANYAPVDLPGAGVERWRPLVQQALGMVGQPAAFDNITLRRMQQESGGNPRAINLTDSNARAGHPSKGLMQLIDGTFSRNWDPRTPNDIWNTLSNVVASMHYALGRYHSLPAAYNRAGGYDSGGFLPPGLSTIWNGTGRPEPVLTDRQWRDISAAVKGSDGGGTVTYNIHEASNAASVAAEVERSGRFRRRIGAR